MEDIVISIDAVYVPVKRRKTLNPESVESLALSIIEEGQQSPILVRRDDDRYVLVEGLHRLEALRALGEETIVANVVQARRR
ncbi:MAG: ParB N-terminal domain-containing protein [Alphaproteobacteria bacterium]